MSDPRNFAKLLHMMSELASPNLRLPHSMGDRGDWTKKDWAIYAAGMDAAANALDTWADVIDGAEKHETPGA